MPSTIRLRMVRHGESEWNVEGRLQGQADIPLTDTGRAQARENAERLAAAGGADLIFCSDLCRAAETAEIIGARIGVEPLATPLLREQGMGRLEGLLPEQMWAEPTPEGMDISEVRWGGGESVVDVMERATRFLGLVRECEPGVVVAVSHGNTLCVLLAAIEGRSHREVEWLSWPHVGWVEREIRSARRRS